MQKDELIIGVDLGASNVRAALVKNGQILQIAKSPLPNDKSYDGVLNTIFSVIDQVNQQGVVGIGVGVPSVVNRKEGIVYNVQNIPTWVEVPLKQILQDRYACGVQVNNDANCFALGECLFGQGRQFKNFVGLAIGTGVAGGIINNGKLLRDVNCGSGEFGEIPYLDGRFEDYCSSLFFTNHHQASGESVFNLAAQGDSESIKISNEFGKHLGKLLYTIILTLDPEAILIGGSISKAFDLYKDKMLAELVKFPYPKSIEKIIIQPTSTPEVQLLGSASLYFDALE